MKINHYDLVDSFEQEAWTCIENRSFPDHSWYCVYNKDDISVQMVTGHDELFSEVYMRGNKRVVFAISDNNSLITELTDEHKAFCVEALPSLWKEILK